MATSERKSYSAAIELRLVIGKLVLPLSQLGPSFAILRESFESGPTDARIELFVDQRISNTLNVYLPNGIQSRRFDFF